MLANLGLVVLWLLLLGKVEVEEEEELPGLNTAISDGEAGELVRMLKKIRRSLQIQC